MITAGDDRVGAATLPDRLGRLALAVIDHRTGRVPRPAWCTYLVCNRCNARCGMCDSWRLPRGRELSPEAVSRVFTELGPLDVVRLSGGEPFLREDLAEVAVAVHEAARPLVLHVTTNGSLPERVLRFAAGFPAPRRLRFLVSFDGMPTTHDESRGKAVTFARALETVRGLVALRAEGLDVSANHTVISRRSLEDHDALRDTLGALGVEVQVVLAYAETAMYAVSRRGTRADDLASHDRYPLHPALAGADCAGFVERLARDAERLSPALRAAKRYYLDGLHQRLTGVARPAPRPRCVALRSHVRLLPNGDVPVCQFNTEIVGNLTTQRLDDLWRSQLAAEHRAWVDACRGCWAECEVIPSGIYTGDLLHHTAARAARRAIGGAKRGRGPRT
ncbi:MAG: radical SAM protein [Polyangiaceae bacterium]|nr:radical SAM protein [Polyangiaceae bacterium]